MQQPKQATTNQILKNNDFLTLLATSYLFFLGKGQGVFFEDAFLLDAFYVEALMK